MNGIRSAEKKGFFDWLALQKADIVCLQETKAQMEVLCDTLYRPEGYECYFHDAEKKGYSGVGIYCKRSPNHVKKGLGWQIADSEGRYIQVDFDNYSVVSIYFPSGTSGEHRQAIKFQFLDFYEKELRKILTAKKPFIICGDWNIAHKNIDLKNWRSNQKNSGFLPEERAWLDKVFDEIGFVDAFREVNPLPDQYTWWSHRGQAWAKNVGWRIDYQVVTPDLKQAVKKASIYRDQKFSDHAPLVMEYAL